VATFIPDTDNSLFQLAADLVNQSSRDIFLTGKAGTGKTTFLKYLRENCAKQMAVVAPTGVAAINAGGVTLHSFFQLPFSPFVPGTKGFSTKNEVINRHNLIGRLRMTNEKKKVLQELELLVIDEISMVRCDVLDAIDTVLRHFRKRYYERFGGVQMLFIGDMFQLPPVIKEPEWKLLSEFYNSPYFFDSTVIREELPVYIEFNKIYRQSEEKFIRLLNQVRNNELDEEGMKILESRYQPAFTREPQDGYIILTTHNNIAGNTNTNELAKLNTPSFIYNAEIKEDFPGNAYPADEILELKAGAQVMFIKNDSDKAKRYFNGKIGVITKLEQEKIMVQCKDEPEEIEVQKEKWENIRYVVDKTTLQMEEEVLGSYVQYPLRLAWAITIHKSQGLTFEKAIIDAGEAFAPGQVYVALSRCISLNGMILQSKIRPHNLFMDRRIVEFSENSSSPQQLQDELWTARKKYLEKLMLSAFDFTIAVSNSKELYVYLNETSSSFNEDSVLWMEELLNKINFLQDTANKFQAWLQQQFKQPISSEENIPLQERSTKAAGYFIKELYILTEILQRSPVTSDSRLHAKEYNESLKEIFAELAAKKFLLEGFSGKFDIDAWYERKRSFFLPAFTVNAYAGVAPRNIESPHPVLHQQLRMLRDSICSKRNTPIYIVAGSKTIDEMALYLPQSLEELRKVSGFGAVKIEQYGLQFLAVIVEYCKERGLSSLIHEKSPKGERKQKTKREKNSKPDTKAESFRLYKEGMIATEIAKLRNLAIQTIEGHLAHYVSAGQINIEELVSREKILLIEPAIKNSETGSITSIKEKLPDTISFGEIKLVLAWQQFQNSIARA
jgi:hypothetical protein